MSACKGLELPFKQLAALMPNTLTAGNRPTSLPSNKRKQNINTCNVGQNPQSLLAKMKMRRAEKCREHLEQGLVISQELKLVIRRTTDNVSKTTHRRRHHLATITTTTYTNYPHHRIDQLNIFNFSFRQTDETAGYECLVST